MELLQELFVTVVVAVLFSFLVAKLVSLGGDSTHSSRSSKSDNLDEGGTAARDIDEEDIMEDIMEDLLHHQKLQVEGFKSEKKVQFVEEDVSQKVDDLNKESKSFHVDDDVIETECADELPLKSIGEGLKQDEDNLVKDNSEIESTGIEVVEEEKCSVQNDAVVQEFQSEEIPAMDCEAKMEKDEELVQMEKKIEVVESDDDWEGIERSELEKTFAKAAKFVESGDSDEGLQMELYALHKVATEGPCREQPPMALKVAARAKCDGGHCLRCARNAWQRLGNMNPEVAMEQYIALVTDKVPGWMEDASTGNGEPGSSEDENPGELASDLSTFSSHHPNITEERNPKVLPDIDKNDLTKVSNLESMAKK